MNGEEQLNLRRLVAAWSDGRGLTQATALVEKHRHLLPRRITHSQLLGLNGIVQAANELGEVIIFTQHQGERAMRVGRQDVKSYWDELRQALEALEGEAADLATEAGLLPTPPPDKKKTQPRPPSWLVLWLTREFVQHLVVHSLYLGAPFRPRKR